MIEATRQPLRSSTARGAAKPGANDAVTAQHGRFDDDMAERAELLREANVLRDVMLEQLKNDDEALKKYIAMI